AEHAGVVLVDLQVFLIDLRRDTADTFSVLVSEPRRPLGVLEERVLLLIEPLRDVHVERADPVRVVRVDVFDDIEEGSEAFLVSLAKLADLDRHGPRPIPSAGFGGKPWAKRDRFALWTPGSLAHRTAPCPSSP